MPGGGGVTLQGQMPGVELGDRHSPLARLLACMREGTEWKRGRAQLLVQNASAKGTRGGSKESGNRSGMQAWKEGSAECECTCKAEKAREGTSVEPKVGTIQCRYQRYLNAKCGGEE